MRYFIGVKEYKHANVKVRNLEQLEKELATNLVSQGFKEVSWWEYYLYIFSCAFMTQEEQDEVFKDNYSQPKAGPQ